MTYKGQDQGSNSRSSINRNKNKMVKYNKEDQVKSN